MQGRRALDDRAPRGGGTLLTEIDIADPAAMRVLRELDVDGSYVSARLHGRTVAGHRADRPARARVPRRTPIPDDTPGESAATGEAQAAARPHARAGCRPPSLRNRRKGRKRRARSSPADDVRRTPRFSGAGMLTVLTIDLAARPARGRLRRA